MSDAGEQGPRNHCGGVLGYTTYRVVEFTCLSVYSASFCSVIASERARLVSKMVLIAGGGPVPLVGVDSCDVFCLPTPVLSCIKPVFLSVYERQVATDRVLLYL